METYEHIIKLKVLIKAFGPIIQYFVPFIIILISTIKLLRKKEKKNYKKFVKSLIIAITIFALATITRYSLLYFINEYEEKHPVEWKQFW